MTDLEYLRWYRGQLEDLVMPVESNADADIDAEVIKYIHEIDRELEVWS